MKIFVILMVLVVALSAQVPMYGPNAGNGAKCPIQTFSASDTTLTSEIRYWQGGVQSFNGSATVAGSMKLTVGTDTLTTFYARLIMCRNSSIDGTVSYDSSAWHTITAQTGDYIPAENDVGATAIDFSFDLASQSWWKPSLGVIISARQGAGAAITKQLELYLIQAD